MIPLFLGLSGRGELKVDSVVSKGLTQIPVFHLVV